ncbi:uncharacterized protein LOC123512535 [Portunus trituberculatus]|uniref:Symplekin n=1 Tax=Portunus trituberculatus TaxID=210409 RepID=A0A5B7H0V3_PORTR|nr:uncharacterized protein LOC123512535 [Portunus trituberculatus]XP_045124897.1 uncharacterized protein LOC123512535 [Portunus trituberculatus]MPC66181.1 Symplekin [Portunus trituberculatus]
MEYAAMLSSPDLVSGLRDLLTDSDVAVVKRTVRVFANVYRHALRLLAAGELDEATFLAAWPAMSGVADHILSMLATAENEGVTVHVVRFLEAALVAHLMSDVSRFPEVAVYGPKMIAKGVAALTDLVSTPYIGGSAFLVAMRALITVACYKPDLWTPVTNLIERQIASPPPTLFDHNVRSLHKTLQRNLFRLLRRADSAALRSQLIEMMVTVGVPRRMLSQWAPPPENRKRPAQSQSEEAITGRTTPPVKRARQEDDDDAGKAAPRDPRDTRANRDPRDPRLNGHLREPRDPRDPRDPRAAMRGDPRSSSLQDARVAGLGQDPQPYNSRSRSNSPPDSGNIPSGAQAPAAAAAAAPASRPDKKEMSNFEFLKSLISTKKKASLSFLERCSDKERALYERLDHPSVVRLVLSCLDSVPDSPPEDLLAKLGRTSGDVTGIREQLTSLLAPHIHADFISGLADDEGSAPPSRPSSNSSAFSARGTPSHSEASPPSPPSSARSTPSDPAQVCHSDVDLRHLLNRGFRTTGDVDMRDTRHLLPREPPATNPAEASRADPRPAIATSTRLDPRIAMLDPRRIDHARCEAPRGGLDPRITQAYTNSHDPMAGRDGPFMEGSRPPYMAGHPPPPHGYMPGGPQGYMEGGRPPFLEGGNGGMVGVRHGFDMPGYEGQYPAPHMGGPQDFMGPRGMMGGGPRGMGGPWQGAGAPHNRMGVMMPLMNGGSGMFSPPMHL